MTLPYEGKIRVTKLYGTPPPKGFTYAAGKHNGIDLVGDTNKNIHAITGGTVIRSRYDNTGWGNYIVIQQKDGISAIYAHLKERKVAEGKTVNDGQLIGVEGSTGNVTGSHLHLELRKKYSDRYSAIDPADYLNIKNKVGVLEMANNTNTVSSWAKEAWAWAKTKGLLDGTRPKDNITREEMAVVLQRFDALK